MSELALEEAKVQQEAEATTAKQGTIAATGIVLESFTRFPDFPLELRRKIWKLVHHGSTGRFVHYESIPKLPVPALLHICKETREEFLPYYTLKPTLAEWKRTKANPRGAPLGGDYTWTHFGGPIDSKSTEAKMYKPRYFSPEDTFIVDVESFEETSAPGRVHGGFQLNRYNKHIFKDVEQVAISKKCWDKFESLAQIPGHMVPPFILPEHLRGSAQAWAIRYRAGFVNGERDMKFILLDDAQMVVGEKQTLGLDGIKALTKAQHAQQAPGA